MKKRFIYKDDKSHKFWEIELDGNSYTTYYGKIGSTPKSDTNEYASDEVAKKEYEKRIKQKEKKGYKEEVVGNETKNQNNLDINFSNLTKGEIEKLINKQDDEAKRYYQNDKWDEAIKSIDLLLKMIAEFERKYGEKSFSDKNLYKATKGNALKRQSWMYHTQKKDLKKALESIEKAIETDPKWCFYYASKASILEEMGDIEGAIDAATKALENKRDSKTEIEYLNNRAYYYYLADKLNEAEEDLLAAIEIDPEFNIDPVILSTAYEIYEKKGDKDNFYKYLELALNKYYKDVDELIGIDILKKYHDEDKFKEIVDNFINKESKTMDFKKNPEEFPQNIETIWEFVNSDLNSSGDIKVFALTKFDQDSPDFILYNNFLKIKYELNHVGLKKSPFLASEIKKVVDLVNTDLVERKKKIKQELESKLKNGYKFYGVISEKFSVFEELFNKKFEDKIEEDEMVEKYVNFKNDKRSFVSNLIPKPVELIHPVSGNEIQIFAQKVGWKLKLYSKDVDEDFSNRPKAMIERFIELLKDYFENGYISKEESKNRAKQDKPKINLVLTKEFTSNVEDFQEKYREIAKVKELNDKLSECRVRGEGFPNKTGPLFKGKFWTTGYALDEKSAKEIDDWEGLDEAIQISNVLLGILKDEVVNSDTDSKFYPFVLSEKIKKDFSMKTFNEAIGINEAEEGYQLDEKFRSRTLERDEKSIFYNLDDLGGEEELGEYYSEESVKKYHLATKFMVENLENVQELRLPWEYITYPVFWVGQTKKGYLTGVWTFRVDT
jgi:predicted DNA-binding WGR domain protein